MLTGTSSLKNNPCFKNYFSQDLLLPRGCQNHFLHFEIFILRNPMRMSKNETTQARLIAETLDLTLHARPGFRNFLVPNFQS